MNNINEIEADEAFVLEQRNWLIEHRATTGQSLSQLQNPLEKTSASTLSGFCSGTYRGDNAKIAKIVFRYRQTLAAQAQLCVDAPIVPGYYETRTSLDILNLLSYAQRGRMTLCVGGPGTSKTMAAKEYAARATNVWYVKIKPSIKTVAGLCTAVLHAMGDFTGPSGAERMSKYIENRLKNSAGLIIYDDAQLMLVEQIEEARAWYDETSIGAAFLGNEKVLSRMEGGARQADYAQLFSRIGMRMIRPLPLRADIDAMADAWKIEDEKVVAFLHQIGSKPGGLRSCTHALEIATMIARGERSEMELRHLQGAWSQLSSRPVAA